MAFPASSTVNAGNDILASQYNNARTDALFPMTEGASIASAATTDLSTATGSVVHITGTTTITAFGTMQAGTHMTLVFDGALTVTYNATSLILAGGINLSTVAGTVLRLVSEGAGNWREVTRSPSSGLVLSGYGGGEQAGNGVVTDYGPIVPGGANWATTTEANVQTAVPRACTITKFWVTTSAAQPAGGSMVFTLRKNGVNTAITLTIAAGAAAGAYSDTAHSASFAAGDLWSFSMVNNASGVRGAAVAGVGIAE